MPYNRIAIYGHRGWASSAIFNALAKSGAPIRVLYRPGSNVSELPENVDAVEVDVNDQPALVAALKNIDIVISLVGHEGVTRQHGLIEAIPHTNVKLFCPSDLSHGLDDRGLGLSVPVLKAKSEVEERARLAGIPITVVQPGCFAESSLRAGLLGVDVKGNKIIFSGDSETKKLNICSRAYVATAYASIFPSTPILQLANRTFGISELQASGSEIANALKEKHGSAPTIYRQGLDEIEAQIKKCVNDGNSFAAVWYYRWMWGSGLQVESIGEEIWDVEGYEKGDLGSLISGEEFEYKDIPEHVVAALDGTFF